MILIILVLIYIVIFALEVIRCYNFLKKTKNRNRKFYIFVFVFVLLIAPISIILGFLFPETTSIKRIFANIGNYALGFTIYLLLGVLFSDIIRLVFKIVLKKKFSRKIYSSIANFVVVVFALSMSFYGIINAHNLKIATYDVSSSKQSAVKDLNVVLISDLHLGYNMGTRQVDNMVNKINSLHPDVVVLAGDVFDNQFSAIKDPDAILESLNNIKSKYGNYMVLGNHDIEDNILCGFSVKNKTKEEYTMSQGMYDFINNSGFKLLYDSYIKLNAENGDVVAYIYGRPNNIRPNFGNNDRVEAKDVCDDLDLNKYIICIDHEPSEQQKLANAGVDLDLNGHTHNGQIWPGTISIKYFWDNHYGLKYYNNMANVVTSGVGLFGPNMRIGSNAEIAQIFIHFNNK